MGGKIASRFQTHNVFHSQLKKKKVQEAVYIRVTSISENMLYFIHSAGKEKLYFCSLSQTKAFHFLVEKIIHGHAVI